MKKFGASIWARDGEFGIRAIGSVQEAQIFLEGWPEAERSPLYHVAASSLKAAEAGSISAEEAREAVVELLESADALAEEQMIV